MTNSSDCEKKKPVKIPRFLEKLFKSQNITKLEALS